MTGYPQVNNPYSMYQNWGYGYQYPVFRGVQNQPQPVSVPQPNVNSQTPPDTVSFRATEHIQTKSKKEGLSTGAKWAIGLGLTALAVGGYLLTRGKAKVKPSTLTTEQIAEKLKITELPAHIDFKEAKTLDEAIKYSKDVLKISNVDDNFSLEALNWVNRGLTDVSNANKGRAKMPNGLKFIAEAEDIFTHKSGGGGGVPANISNVLEDGSFGVLSVEKRLFENNTLDKLLKKDLFKDSGEAVFEIINGELKATSVFVKENPMVLDNEMTKLIERYYANPASVNINDKRLIYFGLLKPSGYEAFCHDGKPLTKLIHSPNNCLSTVYHEQGHLQDMAKNYLEAFKQENGVMIHWNRKDELTQEFIEQTPILKQFFSEAEQNTIGKVSNYAKDGIGEFIAETYAKLVKGVKLDDDVMALYKKYGGPALT